MLIESWRPKIYCEGLECQNISPNGKVLFIEEEHRYYSIDDVIEVDSKKKLKKFYTTKYKFRSPTGILSEFKEKFDSELQAKKYVKKHGLSLTWEEQKKLWNDKGKAAAEIGTRLHSFAESMWNGWNMPPPRNKKTPHIITMYDQLNKAYNLVKTELLVYSTTLRLAGQVDLLMSNKEKTEYYLSDYKFLNKPIQKKSYFNPMTRKYKMMSGPFNKLMDCNYHHYSIQMEIYRYLMGKIGDKVVKKILIIFDPENLNYELGKDITIWVSKSGVLHARYKHYKDRLYDSSKDSEYLANPYYLI